jgi:NAD+ kinase
MSNILVVYKKSMYELYRASPDKAARDFVNGDSADGIASRLSHQNQQKTLEAVVKALDCQGIHHDEIYRADLHKYSGIDQKDYVISVGGDGTFIEVAHYLGRTPLLGINSDPRSETNKTGSVGFFCTANAQTCFDVLKNIDEAKKTELSRLELKVDGKRISELVLNDILIAHSNPSAVTRYRLSSDNFEKEYKSSGLLVCTAAGSTAWMRNVHGLIMPLTAREMQYYSRDILEETRQFAKELDVHSLTREGKIYVDGQHIQYDFTLGSELQLKIGNPLTALGALEAKRAGYLEQIGNRV